MKNKNLLLCVFITFLTISTFAQLKVNSSGKIGIGGWEANNSYEIRGSRSYFSTARSGNSYSTFLQTSYSYVYESMGIGMNQSSEYTLAVNPGTSVENVLYVSDGANRSRGRTLFVNGDAIATQGWHSYSDRRMKKRERRLQRQEVLSKLRRINPKRYQYKTEDELLAMHNAGEAHFPVDTIYKTKKVVNEEGKTVRVPTDKIKKIVIDVPKFRQGDQYGLAAQDVLAEYPELVSMDNATGMYAVDYQGFIPILIEGFNAQDEKIKEMNKQLKKLQKQVKKLTGEE